MASIRGVVRAPIAIGMAMAIVLSACSSAATPAPTKAPTAAPTATGSAAGSAAPSAAANALAEVCQKGKAEGKVVYWGGFDDTIKPVLDKFYAEHPGITVELLAFANEDAVTRTLAEISAGRVPQQDVQSGSMPVFTAWFDRKVVAVDINWEALGVAKDKINQLNIVRHDRAAFGVGYNTTKVKPADLPNTYAGLLDGKWKGRISMDPRGRPFNTLAIAWGKQATIDYVRLMKQTLSPLIIRGETANLTAVIAGEVDISTSGRTPEILEQQAKKAPVDRKFMEIVGTVDNYNLVLANAPHPNAARCFTAWYSGAAEPYKLEFRKKSNDTIPPGVPAGVKIVSSDTAEQSKLESDVATELGKILTAQ